MIYHLIKSKAAPGQTEKARELAVKMIARARALGRDVRLLQGLDEDDRDTLAILQVHESLEHHRQMEQTVRNDPEHQSLRKEGLRFIEEGSIHSEWFEEVG